MELELKKHQEFILFQKSEKIKIQNKILQLNSSFIKVLNDTLGIFNRGHRITSTYFFLNVFKKYNLSYNKEAIDKTIYNLENASEYILSFEEFENVSLLMETYLSAIKEKDIIEPTMIIISSSNYSNRHKVDEAIKILSKNIQHIRNVQDKYKQLKKLL